MSEIIAEGKIMSTVGPASVRHWGVPVAQNLYEALWEEIREFEGHAGSNDSDGGNSDHNNGAGAL